MEYGANYLHSKADELSALYREIKPKVGRMINFCHQIEDKAYAPDLEQVRKEAYDKGYEDCRDRLNLGEIKNDAFDDGYKCGLSDLWEAVRKIMNPFQKYKEEVFDGRTAECIFDVFTPSKVIAKIKTWEEEKQEIKVGDIVRLKDNPESKIWVTNTPDENGMLFGIELKEVGANKRKFERTGEHHEIGTILEKLECENK